MENGLLSFKHMGMGGLKIVLQPARGGVRLVVASLFTTDVLSIFIQLMIKYNPTL